jgi:hypothetical protein
MRVDLSIHEKELGELVEALFGVASSASEKLSKILKAELGVGVHVRSGSLEIVTIIGTQWTPFSGAFSGYQVPSQALAGIKEEGRETGQSIRDKIKEQKQLKNAEIQSSRITTGQVTQLIRVHRQVESGEISHQDAQDEAVRIFERAGEDIGKDFNDRLRSFYKSIPVQAKPAKPKPRRARPRSKPRRRPTFSHGGFMERNPGEKIPRKKIW